MSRRTDFGQRSEGTRYEHSASDNVRFDSFIGWRGQIDKESLVDVGFSYTGEEDAVRCDWCQSVIRDWTKDMDPLVEHVKRAPDCNYLTQLIPAGDLAEMKDQIFDITKMRAPTDGAFTWPCNNLTGERVDEEVQDCMCIRASQQSVEQHTEPDPDNEESNRDAIRSVDMFPNGSEVRETCVQIGASGDGRRVAEKEPHPDTGMPVENIPPRGELYQDAITHGVNEDDNMDHMMQGTAAQSVLQTGYGTEDDVRNAIIDLRRNGKEDFNGEDIMRLIDGTGSYSNELGERVDEEVEDCMCRASQQSVEQHTEPDPDNKESNRDVIRSVDMFPNGSEVRVNCVLIGASGDGRRVAETEPHPDTGMLVENIPARGELYQDAGTHGVNEDDNMDHMMQGTAAQSVLQTGYGTEDDVRNAIIDLRRNGKEDFNGEDIMKLIDGTGSYSNELGERVDEEVEDCMCIRVSQQSIEQHTEPDTDNEESNRDAIRSVDMFPNGSEVRENCVQIGSSGDGRRVAEKEPHPDTGMPVENIPARGELYQDAGTHGVNEDDNMDHMMQGTAAQSVLQTGYGTEDDVRNAIIDLRRNGKEDFNGEDIMRLIVGTVSYSN